MTLVSLLSYVAYLKSSEMDHAVNVWMRLEYFVEIFLFSHVDLEEFRSLSADELDTVESLF